MGVNSLCGIVIKTETFGELNEIITYRDVFKETKDALYLYFDRIVSRKSSDDVLMELESEYLLVCKYDKLNNVLSSPQNVMSIKNNVFGIEGFEGHARFTSTYRTSDFIKRYVYYANPQLFKILNNEVSKYGADYSWLFISKYIDNLENVEKLCKTMTVRNVISMMERGNLIFEDARKLKQVIGIPADIISQLDEMEFGYALADIQQFRRNEVMTIEDMRYMLDFIQSLHVLSKKRKLIGLDSYKPSVLSNIFDCIRCGYKTKAIVNSIAKELMFYKDITKVDISNVTRQLRDCITMASKMNQEPKICQNFDEWHSILARNFAVFQKPRADEFINAAKTINQMYSYRTNEYLIQCPNTENELFSIGFAYHNCLPTYRDRIIDKNAVVLSIYKLDDDGNVIDEIPEYTFEINKNLDIIQLKTFFDADVTNAEIIDVVRMWKKQMQKKG